MKVLDWLDRRKRSPGPRAQSRPNPSSVAWLVRCARRQQGSRSLGLRAALSLAKLYQSTGRRSPRSPRPRPRRLFADAGNAGDWGGAGIDGRRRQCAFVPRGRRVPFRIALLRTSTEAIGDDRSTSIPAVCGQRAKPSCRPELRTMRSWRPEIVAIQICVGSSAAYPASFPSRVALFAPQSASDGAGRKGLEWALWSSRKWLMVSWRPATERKTPRLSRRRVRMARKPSTALSQEAEVCVNWKVQRG